MFHEHINNTVLYVKKREKNNPAFVYITQMSIEKKNSHFFISNFKFNFKNTN